MADAQIAAMTLTQVQSISAANLSAFGLTADRGAHLRARRRPVDDPVSGLSTTNLSALDSTQFGALSTTQIKALTATQIGALAATDISR